MQVKRAIGKATLQKLPIYNEYMRLCLVSTIFCMSFCLFSNCSKCSTIQLRFLYTTFSLCCECSTFSCARTLAMQWSVAWRSAFYRGREHLWIVFSFKRRVSKLESWLMQSITCVLRRNLRQSFSSSPSEQSRSLSHRQLLWIHIPSPHWYWLAPQVVGESAKVNIATSQLVFYCKYKCSRYHIITRNFSKNKI